MVLSKPDPYVICRRCSKVNFIIGGSIAGPLLYLPESNVVECCGCGQSQRYEREEVLPVFLREGCKRLGFRKHPNWYSVYLIVNAHNGLIYVGMTRQSLHKRMELHECSCRKLPLKNSLAIDRAMAELGVTEFSLILLEEVLYNPHDEDRERYYISRLDACNPMKGYNRTGCRTVKEAREAYAKSFREFQEQMATEFQN
ncbi:MAG: Protein containing Excinuclease subunit [Edaphobacter sp.]|nr:Protein containing Excinuclease subunit [Edaphobacter sp.]